VVVAAVVVLRLQRVVAVAVAAAELQQLVLPQLEHNAVRPQLLLRRFRLFLRLRMLKHPTPTPALPQLPVVEVAVAAAEEALPRQQPPAVLLQAVEVRLLHRLQAPRFRSHFIAHGSKRLIPFFRPTRSRKGML